MGQTALRGPSYPSYVAEGGMAARRPSAPIIDGALGPWGSRVGQERVGARSQAGIQAGGRFREVSSAREDECSGNVSHLQDPYGRWAPGSVIRYGGYTNV
jgi:hypothetical protein